MATTGSQFGRFKDEGGILLQTIRKALEDGAKDLAAAIAFWSFFSIFPLLIAAISLAGYSLESEQLRARIYEAVTEMLPGSASLVKDNLESIVRHRGTMSWVGILGLLWTASKAFGAITRSVNRALGAERSPRFVVSKLRYFSMSVAVAVLLVASIAGTVVVEIVLGSPFLAKLGLGEIDLPRVQGWFASVVFVFVMFALIYKVTPYIEVRWRQVLPGALVAAVLFVLGKAGFAIYLETASFEEVYGSLSSIIVLLLWLYLSAWILVLGTEYNIVRWRAKTGESEISAPADEVEAGRTAAP